MQVLLRRLWGRGYPRGTPRAVSGRDGREMSLADVKRILRVFKEDARIPFFSFTGGEPLLRADLEDMIRHARSLGLQVNLVTNGTLADVPRARSLFRAGLQTAQVSLESPREQAHDHLTRRQDPGSARSRESGTSRTPASPSRRTQRSQLSPASTHPSCPAFLKGLGVTRFAMNLYIPVGQRDGRSPTSGSPTSGSPAGAVGAGVRTSAAHDDELLVPYARAGSVIDAVRAAARAEGLVFFWYSPIPHCHYNTIAHGLGNKSCAAMDGLLSVSPAGDVLPCSSYPEPMGNLLDADFRDDLVLRAGPVLQVQAIRAPGVRGMRKLCRLPGSLPPVLETASGTAEIRNPSARQPAPRAYGGTEWK